MKKLNQKAFAPVEVLVVVLILIAVAFIGFTAYNRTNSTNPDSQAETRTTGLKLTGQHNGVQFYACKVGSKPRNGIKIKALNNSGRPRSVYIMVAGSTGTTAQDNRVHLDSTGQAIRNWFQNPGNYRQDRLNTVILLAKNHVGSVNPNVMFNVRAVQQEPRDYIVNMRFSTLNPCS